MSPGFLLFPNKHEQFYATKKLRDVSMRRIYTDFELFFQISYRIDIKLHP